MIERRLVGRQVTTLGTIPAPFRTATVGSPIITEGLVGHWDAGNPYSYPSSGTSWTDLSGNGNTGTLTNGPTFTADRGGGIVFDGANDFVDCGSSSSLNKSDMSVSIEIVLSFNGTSQITTPFCHRRNSVTFEQYAFGIAGANENDFGNGVAGTYLHGFFYPDNAQAKWRSPRYNLSSGIYHAIATSSSSNAVLYVNGEEVSSSTTTSTGTFASAQKTCNIGRNNNGGGQYPGTVFLVRAYSRTLSAAEAFQNFQSLRGRFSL